MMMWKCMLLLLLLLLLLRQCRWVKRGCVCGCGWIDRSGGSGSNSGEVGGWMRLLFAPLDVKMAVQGRVQGRGQGGVVKSLLRRGWGRTPCLSRVTNCCRRRCCC